MATNPAFHTRTALAKGLRELFKQLEERLSLRSPVNVYLAGGMAVHLYTANRVTTDVDAEFGGRVFLPNDLMVEVTLEDGTQQVVYLDTNYNSTFALMHEDYLDDSIPVDLGVEQIHVHVLSPVDLAVSKIARFADNDKEDIAALVRLGLTSADEIEHRATSALAGYIGGQAMLKLNLRDAVVLAREVESERIAALRLAELPRLEKHAGAALTFWRHATEAIRAHGTDGVNWGDVEHKTIIESISENGQPPSDVAEVICQHSPGAVTKARQDDVRALVERLTPELQAQYANARGEKRCEP
jgi:hypothetical protein